MHIITLYNADENVVINDIKDSASPKVTGVINQEINAIDSIEFNIYPDNPGYDFVDAFRTRIESVNEEGNLEFYGRVLKINPSLKSTGEICKVAVCEGYMAFLQDSSLGYKNYSGTLANIIKTIFSDIASANKDKFILRGCCYGSKEMSIDSEGETVYDFLMNKIIAVYGGEVELDEVIGDAFIKTIAINITNKEDISSNEIKMGENLIDFSMDKDMTNLCTYVVPYGAKLYTDEDNLERLDIKSVNGGKDYLKVDSEYGVIEKTLLEPDIEDAGELKKAGQKYLDEHKEPTVSYNITAFDNHYLDPKVPRMTLGKLYYVSIPVFGIDKLLLKITKKTMQIENPANDTFTVGNAVRTASAISSTGATDNTSTSKHREVTADVIRKVKDRIKTESVIRKQMIRKVTQAQYDSMKKHNSKTLYIIKD